MQTANPRRWTALAVIALAQFMVIIDTSIIGVALPEIQADLGFSPGDLSWVFNAYVVALGGRRERVPVLVTLGVRANGDRVVLDMRLVGEESAASWTEVVASLVARHLARPVLAVIDGNPG